MKDNGKKEGIFVKLKDDYALRTMIFSSFSALVTIAFVIFNAYLGIVQPRNSVATLTAFAPALRELKI